MSCMKFMLIILCIDYIATTLIQTFNWKKKILHFKIDALFCLIISFKCVIPVFILCTFQATILCDIVVLYIVKKREVYKSMKYQSVADESVNVSSAIFYRFF